jgi:hypothetical protein
MTDHSHLDELVAATGPGLSLELLRAFQAMIRDPAVGATDYASKLKAVLEDSIQQEQEHAPVRTVDP